jgi:hypothetical protein
MLSFSDGGITMPKEERLLSLSYSCDGLPAMQRLVGSNPTVHGAWLSFAIFCSAGSSNFNAIP